MKIVKKNFFFLSCFLLMGCETLQQRLDASYGEATEALIVAAAQSQHAKKFCRNGIDEKSVERFYKWGVSSGLLLDFYRENTNGFPEKEAYLIENLSKNWDVMSAGDRDKFCLAFKKDVIASENISRIKLIENFSNFRSFFANVPEDVKLAEEKRAKQGAIALGAISLLSTLAGINQTSQGDFSSARVLNSYGAIAANAMPISRVLNELPCKNYLDFIKINNDKDYDYSKYYGGLICSK